ncbi:uncharacterized protein LOC121732348 [Aricia agestis]|uniref:uncharacterized protein LOC121732348 n=1 Tax=Aricia agestis TaxID=91739 RepID=UPI001C20B970|nr:uncharacterized protein LOC121732348 [Aricia agestis]
MYIFIFLAFLSSAYAQIIVSGTCGNETINTDTDFFNMTALATWQEVQRITNQLEVGQCSSITPRQRTNTNNTSSDMLIIREVVNGTARYLNGSVSAYLNKKITVNFTGVVIYLRVLITDSTNYALVYGCRDVANNTKAVYGWKLSRSTTLSSSDLATVNAAVDGTDLQNLPWTTVSHSGESCKVNSAVTSKMSILLSILAAIFAMVK